MHPRNWGVIAFSLALATLPLLAADFWFDCACLEPGSARCLIRRIVGPALGLCLGAAAIAALVAFTRRGQQTLAVFAVLVFGLAGFARLVRNPECNLVPEGTAINDVRTVMSAEKDYAALNGGRYATLECLAGRATCGGILPPGGPLLGPESLRSERLGYRRVFHPGSTAPDTTSSLGFASFAYTAVPIVPGRTGVRSFCGDDRGVICQTTGPPPLVSAGRCDMGPDSPCRVLR
jgi:hypothetical protein